MMDETLRRLNRLPLSRIVKQKMIEFKHRPDPGALYLTQFFQWAWDSGKFPADQEGVARIEQMLMWPQIAWLTLVITLSRKEAGLETITSGLSPEELVWKIVKETEKRYKGQTPSAVKKARRNYGSPQGSRPASS